MQVSQLKSLLKLERAERYDLNTQMMGDLDDDAIAKFDVLPLHEL